MQNQQPKYKSEMQFSLQMPHPFIYYSCHYINQPGLNVRCEEPIRDTTAETYFESSISDKKEIVQLCLEQYKKYKKASKMMQAVQKHLNNILQILINNLSIKQQESNKGQNYQKPTHLEAFDNHMNDFTENIKTDSYLYFLQNELNLLDGKLDNQFKIVGVKRQLHQTSIVSQSDSGASNSKAKKPRLDYQQLVQDINKEQLAQFQDFNKQLRNQKKQITVVRRNWKVNLKQIFNQQKLMEFKRVRFGFGTTTSESQGNEVHYLLNIHFIPQQTKYQQQYPYNGDEIDFDKDSIQAFKYIQKAGKFQQNFIMVTMKSVESYEEIFNVLTFIKEQVKTQLSEEQKFDGGLILLREINDRSEIINRNFLEISSTLIFSGSLWNDEPPKLLRVNNSKSLLFITEKQDDQNQICISWDSQSNKQFSDLYQFLMYADQYLTLPFWELYDSSLKNFQKFISENKDYLSELSENQISNLRNEYYKNDTKGDQEKQYEFYKKKSKYKDFDINDISKNKNNKLNLGKSDDNNTIQNDFSDYKSVSFTDDNIRLKDKKHKTASQSKNKMFLNSQKNSSRSSKSQKKKKRNSSVTVSEKKTSSQSIVVQEQKEKNDQSSQITYQQNSQRITRQSKNKHIQKHYLKFQNTQDLKKQNKQLDDIMEIQDQNKKDYKQKSDLSQNNLTFNQSNEQFQNNGNFDSSQQVQLSQNQKIDYTFDEFYENVTLRSTHKLFNLYANIQLEGFLNPDFQFLDHCPNCGNDIQKGEGLCCIECQQIACSPKCFTKLRSQNIDYCQNCCTQISEQQQKNQIQNYQQSRLFFKSRQLLIDQLAISIHQTNDAQGKKQRAFVDDKLLKRANELIPKIYQYEDEILKIKQKIQQDSQKQDIRSSYKSSIFQQIGLPIEAWEDFQQKNGGKQNYSDMEIVGYLMMHGKQYHCFLNENDFKKYLPGLTYQQQQQDKFDNESLDNEFEQNLVSQMSNIQKQQFYNKKKQFKQTNQQLIIQFQQDKEARLKNQEAKLNALNSQKKGNQNQGRFSHPGPDNFQQKEKSLFNQNNKTFTNQNNQEKTLGELLNNNQEQRNSQFFNLENTNEQDQQNITFNKPKEKNNRSSSFQNEGGQKSEIQNQQNDYSENVQVEIIPASKESQILRISRQKDWNQNNDKNIFDITPSAQNQYANAKYPELNLTSGTIFQSSSQMNDGSSSFQNQNTQIFKQFADIFIKELNQRKQVQDLDDKCKDNQEFVKVQVQQDDEEMQDDKNVNIEDKE